MTSADLGIVVIGRNEGERLRRCLLSLGDRVANTVYVDSGSSDGSVALARTLGADVVELDLSIPFTAARARNAGWERLRQRFPLLALVQFIDGDCEVESGWLAAATAAIGAEADMAVVFGRRRERERHASPYNRISDLEWDVPAGEVEACGGDALMRSAALAAVGGFDPALIAGEEPDLCRRLREREWRIRCLPVPMTVHDAALDRFGQWWRRAVRAGYVEAEGYARLGRAYPRYASLRSHLFWVLVLPLVVVATGIALALAGVPASVAAVGAVGSLALAYALLWWRIHRYAAKRWNATDARCFATFCVLGKWPAVQGMFTYCWRRLCGGPRRLIEYKRAGDAPSR